MDGFQLRLLAVANLFMALMWSRPGGLSLRNAWVTPATIALAIAVWILASMVGVAAGIAGAAGGKPLLVMGGIAGVLLGGASGATALYGLRQRWIAAGGRRGGQYSKS